jgi:hypothetical protein
MESRLWKLVGLAVLSLLVSSSQAATLVNAQANPVAGAQPVWATINASAQGNYPGGEEQFVIFIVNSAQPPAGNETISNMTLTAPFGSNFGIGLPSVLLPGQSLLSTIHLEIPRNYSQNSFVANLVIHATLWNGTRLNPVTITGSATVDVFLLPSQTSGQTSSQSAAQTGTVSSTLFAAGVAIPAIVAVLLLILLVRARGSKRTGM